MSHTCALTTTGTLFCFGDNAGGKCGTGTAENPGPNHSFQYSGPIAVSANAAVTVVDVAVSTAMTCALLSTRDVLCFGFGVGRFFGNTTNPGWGAPGMPPPAALPTLFKNSTRRVTALAGSHDTDTICFKINLESRWVCSSSSNWAGALPYTATWLEVRAVGCSVAGRTAPLTIPAYRLGLAAACLDQPAH